MVEISPLIGRGQRISAAAYTGRAVAPGAVVESDPEAKALITKNSLQLGIVSNQMQNLTAQMQSLTGSLQVIGANLQQQNALEEAKDQQEAELQNKLAQEKLREGKESSIEKKIRAAALDPAQRISEKAQFTLGRLGGFFATIAGGWLLQKGVETIVAYKEGNEDKLNEIKNNILKNLLIAGGVFAAIKLAVPALTVAFAGIGSKLAIIGTAAIFSGPVTQLLNFIIKAGKIVLGKLSNFLGLDFGGGEEGGGDNNTQSSEGDASTLNLNPASNTNTNTNGTGGPSLNVGSTFNTKQPAQQSKPQTIPLNLTLAPPEEEEPKEKVETTPAPANLNMAAVLNKPEYKESKEDEAPVDPSVKAEYGEVSIEPVDTPAAPSAEMEGEKPTVPTAADKGGKNQWWDFLDVFPNKPAASIEPIKKSQQVAQTVSQAPAEPGVTVVPVQAPAPESAPEPQPLNAGGINAAPFFTTNNPDNMYTLGARSNFNVVSV